MTDHYRELIALLNRVHRRWLATTALRAFARTSTAAAVIVFVALAAYAILTPGGWVLIGLAASALAGVIGCFGWMALSLADKPDERRVARFVEERCPELEDRLATAVEFGGRPTQVDGRLLEEMIADAARAVRPLDLNRVVSGVALRRAAIAAVGAGGVLLVAFALGRTPGRRAVDVAAVYAFPSRVTLDVVPGDARVRAGEPLRILVRVSGNGAALMPRLQIDGNPSNPSAVEPGRQGVPRERDAGRQDIEMQRDRSANEFAVLLDSVTGAFTYRVSAGQVSSRTYRVSVVRGPRVARIDLQYDYPASFGLKPRVDEDGGDIYAPVGTRVRFHVRSDRPVRRGELTLADGSRVALAAMAPDALGGELTIAEDGSYRVALADEEGLENPGDTEYFIRTLEDRPPDVRILRPAGDRQVTRLEEVTIDARADDDYGVDRFELVYSVRGEPDKAVAFRKSGTGLTVNGSRTLYLEDLDIQPGDFVSYYARARDVSRGKRSTEARSDIFFLEVTPYEEEFVAAQSQSMRGGSGNRSLDDLAAAQKEIIIATWKLDRRSATAKSRQDIQAVARAQGELQTKASEAAGQLRQMMQDPRRRPRAGQPVPPVTESSADSMALAVEAMGRAHASLEGYKTAAAMPHEMEALNRLLKAQADVRRRQVARQQANGASGGSNRPTQDLSTLFDRELQRQQQTNYETPSSSEAKEDASGSDALDKVRELARRQDELGRQQHDLAKQRAGMTADELQRQLERLTREQSELRRQAEELSRQLNQQPAQPGQSGRQARQGQRSEQAGGDNGMRDVTEEMRRAASELRRQDPAGASARSGRALERLRDLERQLRGRQPDDRKRALGDLQLEARQLADAQSQVASELQHMDEGEAEADGLRRLAGEKERLADRVEQLQTLVKRLEGNGAGDGDRGAIGEAARELNRQQLDRRMREGAAAMRQAAAAGRSELGAKQPRTTSPGDQARRVETEKDLARALDRVAEKIGAAGGERDAESRRLSERLARTRDLRERLADTERKLAQAMRQANERSPGRRGAQQSQPSSSGREGRGGEGTNRDGDAGDVGRLQEEYARQLRQARELTAQPGNPSSGRGGSTPEQWEPSVSAPGTEAFKQDFAGWEVLKKDVTLALENLEVSLSRQLRQKDARDRLNAGPDDRVPDQYRSLVDRYFQSLATRKKDPVRP